MQRNAFFLSFFFMMVLPQARAKQRSKRSCSCEESSEGWPWKVEEGSNERALLWIGEYIRYCISYYTVNFQLLPSRFSVSGIIQWYARFCISFLWIKVRFLLRSWKTRIKTRVIAFCVALHTFKLMERIEFGSIACYFAFDLVLGVNRIETWPCGVGAITEWIFWFAIWIFIW